MKMMAVIMILSVILAGCGAAIMSVGALGSNTVYLVKHNDFLSASRMLVIVNDQGGVVASSGGTVPGGGTITLQTAGAVMQAGAVAYGAAELATALQNAHLTTTGRVTTTGQVTVTRP